MQHGAPELKEMKTKPAKNGREVSVEDIQRLVKHYDWMAQAFKGSPGMGEVRKNYLGKKKQAEAILEALARSADRASVLIDSLFADEVSKFENEVKGWATLKGKTPQVRVTGDALYITHPAIIREESEDPTPRALIFLGVKHAILRDGRGATRTFKTSKHSGQADLTPEERLEQNIHLVGELHGSNVAAHLRKVLAGEIGVMENGPRGFGKVREDWFGHLIRRRRRQLRLSFGFAK
jgi:hypothetical protein